jgi:sugar phosphate isomerase/epimerase
MKTMKGPAIFLAQFGGDAAPFNSFDSICGWAASLGYVGVQVPSWDARLFDLGRAAESDDYCDEVKGVAAEHGISITELSTHLQGQLVAVHPAYDEVFDGLAPREVRGNATARTHWAVRTDAARGASLPASGSRRPRHLLRRPRLALRLPLAATPGRPIEAAFDELGRRWRPILDAFDEAGVDVCYEIHPARTCTTARASSASSMQSAGIGEPASTTTRAISCCSSSIT